MTGAFVFRQTEIFCNAANSAGFCPAAVSKSFHAVCEKILMIFPHVGISHIFAAVVKMLNFFANLLIGHAAAHPDVIVVQSGHADGCSPGFEMMNGRHIECLVIMLNMLAGQRFPVFITFFDDRNDSDPVPYTVFPDGCVVKAAGGDCISPGPEDTLRGSIDTGIGC